jgi:hypothetical protein
MFRARVLILMLLLTTSAFAAAPPDRLTEGERYCRSLGELVHTLARRRDQGKTATDNLALVRILVEMSPELQPQLGLYETLVRAVHAPSSWALSPARQRNNVESGCLQTRAQQDTVR